MVRAPFGVRHLEVVENAQTPTTWTYELPPPVDPDNVPYPGTNYGLWSEGEKCKDKKKKPAKPTVVPWQNVEGQVFRESVQEEDASVHYETFPSGARVSW